MFHAFKLYTGPDNASHFLEGTIEAGFCSEVETISFKETAPHGSYDWHRAPHIQYVITLSGTLKFSTQTGETFILKPGDILLATDTEGSGHKWQLIDDQPWRRIYVVLKPNAPDAFRPNAKCSISCQC